MNKQLLILGTLLALAPALGTAQADRFRAIDRNGDRSISSDEWYRQDGVAPVPFTVVDLDGDGRISESEFRDWSSARGSASARGVKPADRFRAIDRNKDGAISAAEWKDGALSDTPFAAVDANKDGTVSRREFSAWDERRGGPVIATPAPAPGTAAPTPAPARVAAPSGLQPARPATSSSTPGPTRPPTATPSTSPIPGAGSPAMGSGSALTTK